MTQTDTPQPSERTLLKQAYTILDRVCAERDKAEQQRNELLAALRDMLLVANTVRQAERTRDAGEGLRTDAYDSEYDHLTLRVNAWDKAARAAIARAEEGR